MRLKRAGLTVVEVVFAILLFSIGGLGLAAGSAAVARQMSLNQLRSRSSSMARSRDELMHAIPCPALADGMEAANGLRSSWTVTRGRSTSVDQAVERRGIYSMQVDRYRSATPCD
ncbi:MAG: hypothetical protein ABIS03_02500 [Gemmatimonadaceae bacterium]